MSEKPIQFLRINGQSIFSNDVDRNFLITEHSQEENKNMKINRKVFQFPAEKIQSSQVETGLFWKSKKTITTAVQATKEEIVAEAVKFINQLDPRQVVSVSEYTTFREMKGDDGNFFIVVWYWSNLEI